MRVAEVARTPTKHDEAARAAEPGHRRAEALALLRREPDFAALVLDGLDPGAEVAAPPAGDVAVASTLADDPPIVPRLLAALARETTWRGALIGLARRAIEVGRLDDAFVFSRAALGEDPHDPEALVLAGLCEVERGHKAQAKLYLTRAVRIARKLPHHAESMRQAQRLLLRLHFG